MVTKRLVITGANGFVGSNFLRLLPVELKKNCICLLHKGFKKDSIKEYCSRSIFCDLRDSNSFADLLHDNDIIIHLANLISSKNRGEVFDVNTKNMKNIILASKRKNNISVIYISSINSRFEKGEYSISKKVSERLLEESGLMYSIVRPTLIYDDHGGHLLKKLVKTVDTKPILPIIGNGKYLLQPMHIDDLCRFINGLTTDKQECRIYEVGGYDKIAFNELLNSIEKLLQVKRVRIHIPYMFVQPFAALFRGLLGLDLDTICRDKIAQPNEGRRFVKRLRGIKDDLLKIVTNYQGGS